MRVAVTGSSGTVGSTLVPALRAAGHEVVRLVRRPARAADEVRWSPERGGAVDAELVAALHGVEAAVNLAGAGVGDKRWTDSYRDLLLRSRVDATTALVTALTRLDPLPRVLLSGSAYGYYGDTAGTAADEDSPQGDTFLATVAAAWEQAAAPAADAGVRVAYLRTGLVVSSDGGAFARMGPLFRFGLGGRLGSGKQHWSIISLRDHVAATLRLLTDDAAHGPYNLTGPHPGTNQQVTDALGELYGRPTLLPVPAFAVRAVLGGFAEEILGDRRVVPKRLLEAGFEFQDPTVASAVRTLAG